MKKKSVSKVSGKKKFLVSVAIAILLSMFIGYGIEVFDPTPDYNEICPDVFHIQNQTGCEASVGVWVNQSQDYRGRAVKPIAIIEGGDAEFEEQWFCETPHNCYDKADEIRKDHNSVVFVAGIIIGLLAVIIGIVLKKDSVSTGILAGGVLTILYGTIRYWEQANDILKFILLGIALAVLIWISYKLLDKK